MSTRRQMASAAARHQIYLQRYAASHTKQLLQYVNKLRSAVTQLISPDDTAFTKARYSKMLKSFTQLSSALQIQSNSKQMKDLTALAKYEADFTKRLIDNNTNAKLTPFETTIPSANQLKSAAFTEVMSVTVSSFGGEGVTVGEALDKYGSKMAGGIVSKIREGYALGSTTNSIVSSIEQYTDSRIVRAEANTVARTITNHIAAAAREAVYKENDDIITGYQVVATLDDRTSLTCGALDGKVFDKDNFDAPPYHWNCRTTYIGVVDKKYNVSFPDATRPAKGDEGVEQVSSTSNYNSWLKTQSNSFQDDVLGKERAELFRSGVNVDKFVDNNYTPISLSELKDKDILHN